MDEIPKKWEGEMPILWESKNYFQTLACPIKLININEHYRKVIEKP